jgi:putative phosphoribosyl transferase
MLFRDRTDAGRQLAGRLRRYAGREDVIVLALPRGGVPVAFEVASELRAPLDVFLVRKLGLPGREELAMGAIASGGARVINEEVVRELDVPEEVIDRVSEEEMAELRRRERAYRDDRPPPDVAGHIVILVDDGLATGSTMRAGVAALRELGPGRIVVAVPVGADTTCAALREEADEVVCAFRPEPFIAVGRWYDDFSQTSDEEVRELLGQAAQSSAARRPEAVDATANEEGWHMGRTVREGLPEQAVRVTAWRVVLEGNLGIPEGASGVVLFAHGSGSSRHSPRNRFVAAQLRAAGLATLLVDLLTEEEVAEDQYTRQWRFDIDLLANRLVGATDWLARDRRTAGLTVGYFGASTGGGAALVAAAHRPDVGAVVSRGGRPDLAGDALPIMQAPTLLIVGGDDEQVLTLNRRALQRLGAPVKQLAVVPGASHLFEEPGALEEVARLAADWFSHHLGPVAVGGGM